MDTNQIGSAVISRCLSGRYYNYVTGELRSDPQWRVYIADSDDEIEFLLEGKPMKKDGNSHLPAEKLTNNIRKHIGENYKTIKAILKRQTDEQSK